MSAIKNLSMWFHKSISHDGEDEYPMISLSVERKVFSNWDRFQFRRLIAPKNDLLKCSVSNIYSVAYDSMDDNYVIGIPDFLYHL